MNPFRILLPGLIAGVLLLSAAGADQMDSFVVVVNKSNRMGSLSVSKLKVVFLGKISRWPWGAEIVLVDLPDRNSVRKAFARNILDSTPEDLAVYWIDQKVTRSLNPPTRAANVAAAKQIVASKPGAVAYIPASAVDDTVKVMEVR